MKSVFIIWQSPTTRMWSPVAKLNVLDNKTYTMHYTKGASCEGFAPFPAMSDLNKTYFSAALFPFFKNRLMPEARPEFAHMLDWADINIENYDPLELLGVSGGERKTDSFRIIINPVESELYKSKFFISGIRYLNEDEKSNLLTLSSGDLIDFKLESSNQSDGNAILLLSLNGMKVGYCPKYLNIDYRRLLSDSDNQAFFKIAKLNVSAPEQYQVLCEFSSKWPKDFKAFQSNDYLPFSS